MKQVNDTQKVKILITSIKNELKYGKIPIFDKYSISAKELALLYEVGTDKIYYALNDLQISDSKEEFEKHLYKWVELGKKEWQKWKIFIPYDLYDLNRCFQFDKYEFRFTSKNQLIREIKGKKTSKTFNETLEKYNGRFLTAIVYAQNYIHASELIENDFYLFRGVIEFSDNVFMSKISTNLTNLVSLTHPKFIFFISDNECLDVEYYVPPCSPWSYSLELDKNGRKNLEFVQNKLKKLKKYNLSICSILQSVFRMYAYAMEEEYSHNRFLRFWQIAELIGDKVSSCVLTNPNDNSNEEFESLIETHL